MRDKSNVIRILFWTYKMKTKRSTTSRISTPVSIVDYMHKAQDEAQLKRPLSSSGIPIILLYSRYNFIIIAVLSIKWSEGSAYTLSDSAYPVFVCLFYKNNHKDSSKLSTYISKFVYWTSVFSIILHEIFINKINIFFFNTY